MSFFVGVGFTIFIDNCCECVVFRGMGVHLYRDFGGLGVLLFGLERVLLGER